MTTLGMERQQPRAKLPARRKSSATRKARYMALPGSARSRYLPLRHTHTLQIENDGFPVHATFKRKCARDASAPALIVLITIAL